ncbi:MAG TPA: lysylphosphatidylglycerol synthase transmembrane domain-containing protein [Chloroflexota bacterium]|nr:lysylphosphatidylglycerol synthase transmembrane domain-containing protein [Chloroflexota bacterium]
MPVMNKEAPDVDPAVSSPASESNGDIDLKGKIFNVRTGLSFLIAFGILALVVSRLDVNVGQIWPVVRSANPLLFVAALVVYYSAFPIRALRWRLMLRNAGVKRSEIPTLPGLSEIIFLSWFANCLVPAKLGDVYRAYLLRKHGTVSLSKAGGTIVAERLIDFAIALSLLGLTGLLAFRGRLPDDVVLAIEIGSVMVLIAGIGLLLLRYLDEYVARLVPHRFQGIYSRFHEGAIGSFGRYPRLLGLTVAAWLPEAIRFFLITQAVGVVLAPDLATALAVSAFIALGSAFLTALPLTPAGLGFAEGAITVFLALIGVDPQVALSVALLDRTISYWSLIAFGLLAYPFARRK